MNNNEQSRIYRGFVAVCLLGFFLSAFFTLFDLSTSFGIGEPLANSDSAISLAAHILFYVIVAAIILFSIAPMIQTLESSNNFIIILGLVSIGFWTTAFLNNWLIQRKLTGIHQFLDAEFRPEFVEKCLQEAAKDEITFAHNGPASQLKVNSSLQFGYEGYRADWLQLNQTEWKWKYTDPYVHLAIYGDNNEGLACVLNLQSPFRVISVRSFDDIIAESEARHEAAEESRP